MILNHNMYSLSIFQTYKKELAQNAKASNNINTGAKINGAKDNPYKIGRNETLKIKVLTSDAASRNIQDTNSMLQTFDSSLQGINDNLCRLRELTVSAGSGVLTATDRDNIQKEIDNVKANIDELANNTDFNGVKLSEGPAANLPGDMNPTKVIKSTIGNMDDENIDIPIYDVTTANLGISSLSVKDAGSTDSAIAAVDKATTMVDKIRSKYGSLENRLEGTDDYLGSKEISLEQAQSNIGDADVAEEMMNFSRTQILIQSSAALMSQSNKFPQDCLNILGNVK